MSVYIIDELMGRGKTSAMINHINTEQDQNRFLFIVPYMTEVERIIGRCSSRSFKTPIEKGGKLNNIKPMLREGLNIVSTHALFSMFDQEILSLVKEMGYTLVMDEVACVISQLQVTSYDSEDLLRKYVSVCSDGRALWEEDDYDGKLIEYKKKIVGGNVYVYGGKYWLSLMPEKAFTSFRDVYLMTYMFDSQIQRCYFDIKGIYYERLYVSGNSQGTYRLSTTPEPTQPIDFRAKIHILDAPKLNRIGDERTALSKNWYKKNTHTPAMKQLQNNTYNFFRNYAKTPSSLNLWTTFCKNDETKTDWPKLLSRSGYAKGFLSCTARGTNDYRNRTAVAYLVNRFPNSWTKNFLTQSGIDLDSDGFALSEMLQFIWRSAIRNGKEIQLYIPSKRMRTLLTQWITTMNKRGNDVEK